MLSLLWFKSVRMCHSILDPRNTTESHHAASHMRGLLGEVGMQRRPLSKDGKGEGAGREGTGSL